MRFINKNVTIINISFNVLFLIYFNFMDILKSKLGSNNKYFLLDPKFLVTFLRKIKLYFWR